MTLYFAYGSNMDPTQMHRRCPGSLFLGPAILPDHRLTFRGASVLWDGGGVATVVRNTKKITRGVLWMLRDEQVAALDRCEGVPRQYTRIQVQVRYGEQLLNAFTYKLNSNLPNLPAPAYWDKIRKVYAAHQWPAKGLDQLQGGETDIFVYGTLRRTQSNHRRLQHATFVRDARTAPCYSLLHLGSYPGMIHGKTRVQGEIWRINQLQLRDLDRFEGHPIFYRRSSVELDNGEVVEGYLYQNDGSPSPRIHSGDWMVRERLPPPPSIYRPSMKTQIQTIITDRLREEREATSLEALRGFFE